MLRFLLVLAIVSGCKPLDVPRHKMPSFARAALEHGSAFELLSLDPGDVTQDDERVWFGPTFHDHRLLGRAPIADPATRERLVRMLEHAADRAGDSIDLCFDPRHAIRVSFERRAVDFVICFECGHVETYIDDTPSDTFQIVGAPDDFNAAAAIAGLPLSAN